MTLDDLITFDITNSNQIMEPITCILLVSVSLMALTTLSAAVPSIVRYFKHLNDKRYHRDVITRNDPMFPTIAARFSRLIEQRNFRQVWTFSTRVIREVDVQQQDGSVQKEHREVQEICNYYVLPVGEGLEFHVYDSGRWCTMYLTCESADGSFTLWVKKSKRRGNRLNNFYAFLKATKRNPTQSMMRDPKYQHYLDRPMHISIDKVLPADYRAAYPHQTGAGVGMGVVKPPCVTLDNDEPFKQAGEYVVPAAPTAPAKPTS